jgi:hypothetical protein
MALRLDLYEAGPLEQVRRFNARLREGNVDAGFLLPESASPQYPEDPLEKRPGAPFTKRQFLAVEEGYVRGGFLLQEQPCEIAGGTHWCANIQAPISEGLVDRKFSYVAPQMLRLLLRDRPFVFAVGMGSAEAPFAKFLSAMKWRVLLVPFRFYVLRPAHFLREIQVLHSSPARACIANIAAWSGLGTAAILALQRVRTRSAEGLFPERIHEWDDRTASLWSRYRTGCSFSAVRDGATLPFFLDLTDSRLSAYRLSDGEGVVRGWMVLQVAAMLANKYFGSLRVATLLDTICEPGFERAAVRAAIGCARDQNADLVVTNQQHRRWLAATGENGFWKAPSNYVFATSPQLTKLVSEADPEFTSVHLSRADGDGRMNL